MKVRKGTESHTVACPELGFGVQYLALELLSAEQLFKDSPVAIVLQAETENQWLVVL